ncbi:MAG: SurA N-terminal domain-containing protein, partial [Halioglobus sp.]|nr:SurA N-terminal domain-containing protein [Halioglobus sp.]
MLQDIRSNVQGTAAKIIVGLIVISFSIFGIESILLGGGGDTVAEVNGEEIGARELQQAVSMQTRNLIAMMGQNYDPALLDESRIRNQALQGLIGRKVMMQSVEALGLTVSEAEIGRQVGAMEQFRIDGKFDPELYKRALSDRGFTPGHFKQVLSGDIVQAQLRAGLAGSEFATPAELELNASILGELRDFRYLSIPGQAFAEGHTVTDEEISAFYEDRQAQFMTEESVDLEYLQLGLDDFRQPVAEEAIIEAYDSALQDMQLTTENRISHILLTEGKQGVAERVATIKSRLAQGEDFALLATEFSEDVGSANRGGDLGYSSGDAFPEEIETAVAALEPGTVSAAVETDAGTHLLLVTERRDARPPTLEEMRGQLQQSLQDEAARAELLRTVETLRDLSFNAEDLAEPASELGLEISSAMGITRDTGAGIFDNAALRDAAFSDEVLGARHNSEVIDLAGETFVTLRVKAHHEPSVRPLEEVRADIVAAITDEAARAAVAREAQDIIARMESGTAIDDIASDRGYEWQVELGASRQAFAVSAPV